MFLRLQAASKRPPHPAPPLPSLATFISVFLRFLAHRKLTSGQVCEEERWSGGEPLSDRVSSSHPFICLICLLHCGGGRRPVVLAEQEQEAAASL